MKGRFASVDPGADTGLAIWENGRLNGAWSIDPDDFAVLGLDELVIEEPKIYPRKRKDKNGERWIDPNAIVKLGITAGQIAGIATVLSGAKIVWYLPEVWKGQLPKEICHERALAALNDDERGAIHLPKAKKKRGDLFDAVALGLYHLGRSRSR